MGRFRNEGLWRSYRPILIGRKASAEAITIIKYANMSNQPRTANVSRNCVGTILLLMVALSGCGGVGDEWTNGRPPVYPSSGEILYNGNPLEGANVIFSPVVEGVQDAGPNGAPGAAGRTDAEGRFVLTTFRDGDGAPAGRFRVTVLKAESVVTFRADDPAHDQIPLKTEQKHLIPAKYSNPAKSGLEAEVEKSGKNVFAFELKD